MGKLKNYPETAKIHNAKSEEKKPATLRSTDHSLKLLNDWHPLALGRLENWTETRVMAQRSKRHLIAENQTPGAK